MKLIKFLVINLCISRREACELINKNKITVNNKPVTSYSEEIHELSDSVYFENKKIHVKKNNNKNNYYKYYAFYKPCDVEVNMKNMAYFLDKMDGEGLKPAGRLDKDSEGLLLISNNGDFINIITHPRHLIKKIYEIELISPEIKIFEEKIKQELSEKLEIISHKFLGKNLLKLIISLREGKNRQIRRICSSCGLFVKSLKRTQVGNIKLENLKAGQWKVLNTSDVKFILCLREKI